MAKWSVERCVDGRFAYLAYRSDKGGLLQIPGTEPPWNDAYIHMSRVAAEHLLTYIESLVNEIDGHAADIRNYTERITQLRKELDDAIAADPS